MCVRHVHRVVVCVFACVFLTTATGFGQVDGIVLSYATDAAPVVDGIISPGEWDAAGPPIPVTSTTGEFTRFFNNIAEDAFGGDSDLSYQFRAMWDSPWDMYFLVEVTDDIAYEDPPRNGWEPDQVELLIDGDELEGGNIMWWTGDPVETYGKFGVSRDNIFEGNTDIMTDDPELIDDEFTFGAGVAAETGENANYFVEYVISLAPAFDAGLFEDTPTEDAEEIIPDSTTVKFQIHLSDNDNFDNGDTQRSSSLDFYRVLDGDDTDWFRSDAWVDLVFTGPFVGGPIGDFNKNGILDSPDIDDLTGQSAAGTNLLEYDLNADSLVNEDDIGVWIRDLFNSWVGDANLDGQFSSSDLVTVLSAGTYEIDVDAVWSTGDFNGDGRANSGDLVAALSDGGYEVGPRAAVRAVPEPTSWVVLMTGILAIGIRPRCRARRS